MATYNETYLTCNDLAKFITLIKDENIFGTWTEVRELSKEGVLHLTTQAILPDNEIKQLSKNNPNLIFTAKYWLESKIGTITIVEYKNGIDKEIDIERIYFSPEMDLKYESMGESYNKLLDKAEKFSRVLMLRKKMKMDYILFLSLGL